MPTFSNVYYIPDGVYAFIHFCRNEDGRMLTSGLFGHFCRNLGAFFSFTVWHKPWWRAACPLRFARRGAGSEEGSHKRGYEWSQGRCGLRSSNSLSALSYSLPVPHLPEHVLIRPHRGSGCGDSHLMPLIACNFEAGLWKLWDKWLAWGSKALWCLFWGVTHGQRNMKDRIQKCFWGQIPEKSLRQCSNISISFLKNRSSVAIKILGILDTIKYMIRINFISFFFGNVATQKLTVTFVARICDFHYVSTGQSCSGSCLWVSYWRRLGKSWNLCGADIEKDVQMVEDMPVEKVHICRSGGEGEREGAGE